MKLMKWTGLNELREQFLSFFESKGHTRMPSASLVPKNDKSLLLINSGMAPLKKYFLGLETPPNHRVTTCQKCIRTPDIDSVGHDDRHGTMLMSSTEKWSLLKSGSSGLPPPSFDSHL